MAARYNSPILARVAAVLLLSLALIGTGASQLEKEKAYPFDLEVSRAALAKTTTHKEAADTLAAAVNSILCKHCISEVDLNPGTKKPHHLELKLTIKPRGEVANRGLINALEEVLHRLKALGYFSYQTTQILTKKSLSFRATLIEQAP